MIGFPGKNRSTHLGPYPLETLPRDLSLVEVESQRTQLRQSSDKSALEKPLSKAAQRYQSIFEPIRHAEVVATQAPVPENLERRSRDIKGGAHFLDASQVGICKIPTNAW